MPKNAPGQSDLGILTLIMSLNIKKKPSLLAVNRNASAYKKNALNALLRLLCLCSASFKI